MTFKERLPYFLIGLFIGTIIVAYIFREKNAEFSYGPNARVLKNIRIKKRVFSEETLQILRKNKLDTSMISTILKNGNVDMWNKKRLDSCIQYHIKGKKPNQNIQITVQNCDSTAFVKSVKIE